MTQTASWLIAADDRTGALEVAGACARAGRPVAVVAGIEVSAHVPVPGVVDLGTRHLSSSAAAARAVAVDGIAGAMVHAHKIDSTLRGNWASELAARQAGSSRPVLVVPALPALGRVCVDGLVLEHGRPVAEGGDARGTAAHSRPAAVLAASGASTVTELHDLDAVHAWLSAPTGIAVADASSDDQLAGIGGAWSAVAADVLLAGTSAAIAAGIAALDGDHPHAEVPTVEHARVIVVCGSLHQAARRQLAALRASLDADALDAARIAILASDEPARTPVPAADAAAAATALAASAAGEIGDDANATVIVLGGDTAAAVMGDAAWTVGGTVAPGTPWMRRPGSSALLITRAGGFGDDDALVRLIRSLAPAAAGARP